MPVRQSFAVEMVGREDIGNAVALNSAMFNGARVVGPAVAGLTIGAFGVGRRLRRSTPLSFLAVIVGLAADARATSSHAPPRIARPTSVAGGVRATSRRASRYVRQTPVVLLAVLVVGLVATVGMNFSVVDPAARRRTILHSDAAGYGFLMAASGVGSLLAALSARLRRRGRGRSASRLGAIVLGVAAIGARGLDVVPAVARR